MSDFYVIEQPPAEWLEGPCLLCKDTGRIVWYHRDVIFTNLVHEELGEPCPAGCAGAEA